VIKKVSKKYDDIGSKSQKTPLKNGPKTGSKVSEKYDDIE
jgi:hypothetical protein